MTFLSAHFLPGLVEEKQPDDLKFAIFKVSFLKLFSEGGIYPCKTSLD